MRTENDLRAKMLKEKEIATMGGGIKRGRTGYVTEKIEKNEKVLELQEENEALRHLVQNMEHLLREQKKSNTTFRGGYEREGPALRED